MIRKAMFAAILVLSSIECRTQSLEEYTQIEVRPSIGSNIKAVVLKSQISLDKTRQMLKETELQELIRWSSFDNQVDLPPFPASGVRPITMAIARVIPRGLFGGALVVAVVVDASGAAVEARVLAQPTQLAGRIAAGALLFERYQPAICAGAPCTSEYIFKVDVAPFGK